MTIVEYLLANTAALLVVVALFGLIIGSFLNVVIYRLPVMMEQEWRSNCAELLSTAEHQQEPAARFDLLMPSSRCPQCGHKISALENIPVLSYLALRGKCSACGMEKEKAAVHYACTMCAGVHSHKPGKCGCGMDLVLLPIPEKMPGAH